MSDPIVPATCKVVGAVTISKALLAEVAEGLAKLNEKPKLVGFLANEDPAAQMYADWSAKTCVENGFLFDLRKVDREEIEDKILAANIDPTVHGIIVYYPIFPASSGRDHYLQQLVSLEKDVEGLSSTYISNMYQNIRFLDPPTNEQKSILPCTPLAVVKVLEHLQIYNSILPYGNRLFGKTITVINRSEVVGRPLAALLANDGAKVYSVDLDGVQLFTRGQGIKKVRHEVHVQHGWTSNNCLPLSDVIISGVPGNKFKVDTTLIRDGAVCINFSSDKNFDGPAIKEKASIYVAAIGKVTIAVLLRNLLRLVHNQAQPNTTTRRGSVVNAITQITSNNPQPQQHISVAVASTSPELTRQASVSYPSHAQVFHACHTLNSLIFVQAIVDINNQTSSFTDILDVDYLRYIVQHSPRRCVHERGVILAHMRNQNMIGMLIP